MRRLILMIERVAGIFLGLVTVFIFISSIGRYGFAAPIPDTFDLSRLVLGIAIVWGIACIGFNGTHIKVDLLANVVKSGGGRRFINAIAWGVLLVFTALLVWKIGSRVVQTLSDGTATMQLLLPHWPFFICIWLGLVAALLTTAIRLFMIVFRAAPLEEDPGEDYA